MITSRRAGVEALNTDSDPASSVEMSAIDRVFAAAADELGWAPFPDRWPDVFTQAGLKRLRVDAIQWTVGQLHRVLKVAAGTANRELGEFCEAVRQGLGLAIDELEQVAAKRRAEESRLAEELFGERQRAAAARVYADEGLVQRVMRAEGHLSRELDRTLVLLAERRVERGSPPSAVRTKGSVVGNEITPRLAEGSTEVR